MANDPEHWRTTRDAKNLQSFLEWERERAKLHREFAAADAYELMDDEPERTWAALRRVRNAKS